MRGDSHLSDTEAPIIPTNYEVNKVKYHNFKFPALSREEKYCEVNIGRSDFTEAYKPSKEPSDEVPDAKFLIFFL